MLTRVMTRQHNLHIHAYPNYQALFRTRKACVSSNEQLATAHNRPLMDNYPH